MRVLGVVCAVLFSAVVPLAVAQDVVTPAQSAAHPPASGQVTTLQGVTVSGVQPGPGLWKISKGGHVLWVLGTLRQLPKKISWQPREVQAAIAESQEVLQAPQVSIHAQVGFFGKLALLPSLMDMRNNPDGKKLADVVPPEQYARWLVLKAKYLGHDRDVEQYRPLFAALELYQAAIKQANLTGNVVEPAIKATARRYGVTRTPVIYPVEVKDPRAIVKNFKSQSLEDRDCFSKMLDHLETDVAVMREQANAWAVGDLNRLRELPVGDENYACRTALTESGVARQLGVTDLPGKVEATWVAAAEKALNTNRTTFALLPMSLLLGTDNYLMKLQDAGYEVEAPE